jgi:hypothetical protein
LVAAQLDELWDSSMATLSKSYLQTLSLLDQGTPTEAYKEFKTGFVTHAKKLYAEAGKTYPLRFSKMKNWCDWTKRFYVLTRHTEDALKKGQADKAREILASLRAHLHVLHVRAQLQKSNDYIYAYRATLLEDKPVAADLSAIQSLLEKAEPSTKAKASGDKYGEAKSDWSTIVTSLLQDGVLDPDEIQPLRTTTETFYQDFGAQFD